MEKDLQRIDLKVFVDAPSGVRLDPILTAFDRWRQEADAPSDWVDLADYAHMRHGPGVMMAGKREHIAVDTNVPGAGILVQTRKGLEGDLEARFVEAFRRHLALSERLASEPEWPRDLRVRAGDWMVVVNDRLQFPNDDSTDRELRGGIEAALGRVFGAGRFRLTRESADGERYGLRVAAEDGSSLRDLLARLS